MGDAMGVKILLRHGQIRALCDPSGTRPCLGVPFVRRRTGSSAVSPGGLSDPILVFPQSEGSPPAKPNAMLRPSCWTTCGKEAPAAPSPGQEQ